MQPPGDSELGQLRAEIERRFREELTAALATAAVPADRPIVDSGLLDHGILAWGAALRIHRADFGQRMQQRGEAPGSKASEVRHLKLRDLAWTLACERNRRWRAPEDGREEDAEADERFARLLEHCSPAVRTGVAGRLRCDATELDELVQSAWTKLVANHLVADAERPFLALCTITTWLVTVAHNEGIRKRPGDNASSVEEQAGVAYLPPINDAERQEISAAIEASLSRLPARQRLVVGLRLLANIPASEVADRLNTTRPNVANLYKAGLERLRRELADRGFDLDGAD